MVKANIQQIRTAAHDPAKLADFYNQVFGMKIVFKPGATRGVFLTDGHVSLEILQAGADEAEGLRGIGFLVDDLEEVEALATHYVARSGVVRRFGTDDAYAEAELVDPIGISVELSERGFGVDVPDDVTVLSYSPDPWAPRPENRPRIQHIATGPLDQERMVDFYCNVFGMHVVYRRGLHVEDDNRPGGIFLTDGRINFACNVPSLRRGGREGLNHFGFFVEDSEETYRTSIEAGAQGAYPTPSGVYAEGHIADPIGVRVDVAQLGFAIEPPTDVHSFQGHDGRVGRGGELVRERCRGGEE